MARFAAGAVGLTFLICVPMPETSAGRIAWVLLAFASVYSLLTGAACSRRFFL